MNLFTRYPRSGDLRPWRQADFGPALAMGGALLASGLAHLAWLWLSGAEWEGPVSPRKPGLFGVSAGLTVWSLVWVLTRLKPRRYDRTFATSMAGCLLAEVALITAQYWRGVPSHFNRATTLDAAIEGLMLALISVVTGGVALLTWRSSELRPMPAPSALAIRSGLWLLLISCGLGFLATYLGELSLARGHSPEVWGTSGVLKYPHGAAMHAIQALPLLAWLLPAKALWPLRLALFSQVCFLALALWQTLLGRGRFELDFVGGSLMVMAVAVWIIPLVWLGARSPPPGVRG